MPFGFSSFSKDLNKHRLDLNDYVVSNQPSTFFVKYAGETLSDIGVFQGDLLSVDRSLDPQENSLVLVYSGNQFLIRLFRRKLSGIELLHPVSNILDKEVVNDSIIWGVLTYVIHKLHR